MIGKKGCFWALYWRISLIRATYTISKSLACQPNKLIGKIGGASEKHRNVVIWRKKRDAWLVNHLFLSHICFVFCWQHGMEHFLHSKMGSLKSEVWTKRRFTAFLGILDSLLKIRKIIELFKSGIDASVQSDPEPGNLTYLYLDFVYLYYVLPTSHNVVYF